MNRQVLDIPLAQIDFSDPLEHGIIPGSIEELKGSISKIGMIHPVLIKEGGKRKSYLTVCGARRLYASLCLGLDRVPAILAKDNLEEHEIVKIRILDNLGHRRLNLIEQSNLMLRLSRSKGIDTKEILEKYMPLLGYQKSLERFNILKGLKRLNDDLQETVIRHDLPFKTAYALSELKEDDQRALADMLSMAHLSTSALRRSIGDIKELAKIRCRSLSSILNDDEVRSLLEGDLDRVAKGKKLSSLIERMRYPKVHSVKEEISRKLLGVKTEGTDVMLKDLDEGSLILNAEFNSIDSLAESLELFLKDENKEVLKGVLRMLHE